jgi:HK97 family phage major capsid protein
MAGVSLKAFAGADGPALEMSLIGEVGWQISARDVQVALAGQKDKPLTVNLFSYGGDAIEGLAIYSMLARHEGKKRMVIDGVAASAASVIAMAGDEIVMPQSSFLMIHECWSLAMGGAGDLRKEADVIDRISAAYLQAYVKRSKLPEGDVQSLMAAESWLTADEALEFGFATEVSAAAEIKAMGVPDGRFAKVPAALREKIHLIHRNPEDKISAAATREPVEMVSIQTTEVIPMLSEETTSLSNPVTDSKKTMSAQANTIEVNERESLVTAERERGKTIRNLCEQVQAGVERAEQFIDRGMSVDDVRAELFAEISGKRKIEFEGNIHNHGADEIGLTKAEKKGYSMIKLAHYLAEPNPRTADQAGFELEVSRAVESKHGRSPSGVLVPWEVLGMVRAAAESPGQTVGSFSDGGATVSTDYLGAQFIDLIRNSSAFLNTGLTVITGLEGNVEIPKKLTSSQWYMVGENVDVPNSKLTFGTVNMIPRQIGVRVPISRRMMKQSSLGIENLVRQDMAESVSLGMDKNIAYGTGNNNQPLGIKGTFGIGSVTLGGGTSLAVSADLGGGTHDFGDWADYVALETAIYAANLNVASMRYVGNSAARGALKTTLRASNSAPDYILRDDGTVNGYQFLTSNQMEQNDVLFGNFSDVVVGMWSGLDVILDPYTQGANGQVILTCMQDFDVAVRRPQSFALGT